MERVQNYTKYEIGRKVSKNTESFSRKEIEEGMFNTRNAKVMRILIKWCEELEMKFKPETIYNREEPFLMKDGNEEYLSSQNLEILVKNL